MREVVSVKREKKTYNMSVDEFRKGEWLNLVSADADAVDVVYKNNYLTIAKMKTTKLEKRGTENGPKPRIETRDTDKEESS